MLNMGHFCRKTHGPDLIPRGIKRHSHWSPLQIENIAEWFHYPHMLHDKFKNYNLQLVLARPANVCIC